MIITCFFVVFSHHFAIIINIKQNGKFILTSQNSYLHYYVVYPSMRPNLSIIPHDEDRAIPYISLILYIYGDVWFTVWQTLVSILSTSSVLIP